MPDASEHAKPETLTAPVADSATGPEGPSAPPISCPDGSDFLSDQLSHTLSPSLSLLFDRQTTTTTRETANAQVGLSDRDSRASAPPAPRDASIALRIPASLRADLEDVCRELYLDMSVVVRQALTRYLAEIGYDRLLREELAAFSMLHSRLKASEADLEAVQKAKAAQDKELAKMQRELTAMKLKAGERTEELLHARKRAKDAMTYKSEILARASQDKRGEVIQTGLRLWKNSQQSREGLVWFVQMESRGMKPANNESPTVWHGLAMVCGGYGHLKQALEAETGVTA